MVWINDNAFNRTDFHALLGCKVADALSAESDIDLIDFRPHRNGLVRAFGLANITVDAFVSNQQGHISVGKRWEKSRTPLAIIRLGIRHYYAEFVTECVYPIPCYNVPTLVFRRIVARVSLIFL